MCDELNPAAELPSSQDLDAIAAERRIAEQTALAAVRPPLPHCVSPSLQVHLPQRRTNRKKLLRRSNRAHR